MIPSSVRASTILSIETCTAAGSVAVLFSPDETGEKVLANNEWLRSRSHAEVTTPAIEDAVKIAGGWTKIEILAVGIGPGSFTGIRVGLNAARAIAWSTNRALVPIRSTDALIEAARVAGVAKRGDVIVAVLNAQMGLYFAAWETSSTTVTAPAAFDISSLGEKLRALKRPITLLGESAELVAPALQAQGLVVHRNAEAHLDLPHALSVARLAARVIRESSKSLDPSALVRMFNWRVTQPLYLRGSGAEEKMG